MTVRTVQDLRVLVAARFNAPVDSPEFMEPYDHAAEMFGDWDTGAAFVNHEAAVVNSVAYLGTLLGYVRDSVAPADYGRVASALRLALEELNQPLAWPK